VKNFICESCSKHLEVNDRVYDKAYKGHHFCLDCRALHGGKREGAGRPSLGTTRKVSITLPDEVWERIDDSKTEQSMSAFLRELIMENYE
jgi:hypothetical protein